MNRASYSFVSSAFLRHTFLGLLLCVAFVSSACGFTEGNPWGLATFEVSGLLKTEGREGAGGEASHLKTSTDYGVDLQELSLELVTVAIGVAKKGGAVSFDPAKPPEGYTLCHNGHCHATDGRLVDYEDIEVDVASGSSSGEVKAEVGKTFSWPLTEAKERFRVAAVSDLSCVGGMPCDIPKGDYQLATVIVKNIHVKGKAYDTRSTKRISDKGVSFAIDLPGELTIKAPLKIARNVDKVDQAVRIELQLDAAFLDKIDYTLSQPTLSPDVVKENIKLDVSIKS